MQKNMLWKQISSLIIHVLASQYFLLYLPLVVSDECSISKNPLIFNFGDSNSDTGGFSAAYGYELAYPYGRTFFHRSTGRSSDGRLIIDFLCENLNSSYLSPYLDSLDPNFTTGANFAIIAAATFPRQNHFSLDIQVQQFRLFKKRYLDLQSIDLENAVFTFDIGQNDLSGSFGVFSLPQVIDRIPTFISEIRDAMWGIYLLGGKNFWVHNTGPLGCLPREIAIRNHMINATDMDQHGCLKSLNEGAKAFNHKLNALCHELRSQMKNSTIVYVDVYSIKYNLVAKSTSYGFKNPLMVCCGYGGAPYNFNPNVTCLNVGYTACEEGTPYISWDGTHYTEAANAIVTSKILSTKYSTPPLHFNFFCNNKKFLQFDGHS